MRIRSGQSCLSIEKVDAGAGCTVWHLEAQMSGDAWSFAFADGNVRVDTSADIRKELGEFNALRTERLHIMFSSGGWLRVRRDSRGGVLVGFHLTRPDAGAAVHGEVGVERGSGTEVCRELTALL